MKKCKMCGNMLPDKATFCDMCGNSCERNADLFAYTSDNYETKVLSDDKSFSMKSETSAFDQDEKASFRENGENEQKASERKDKAIKISVAVLTALVVAVLVLLKVLPSGYSRVEDNDSVEPYIEVKDNKEYHYNDIDEVDYVVILNDLGEPQEFYVYYGNDDVQEEYKPMFDENNTVIGIIAHTKSDNRISYYKYEPDLYSMKTDLFSNLPLRYNMTQEEYYTDSSCTEISYYLEHVFEVNGSEYIDNVTEYDRDGIEVGFWSDECDKFGNIK